jgi:hypothetical protein
VRHFGLLCSITMVIAVFTELFLLPALLVTLRVGRVAVRAPLSAVGGGEGAAPAALLARQRSAAAEE